MTDEEKKEMHGTPEDTGKGVQSQADEEIKRINEDTARVNRAIAENENAKARARLAGITLTGEKASLTPEQEKNKKAQDIANEIVGAFRNK